MKLNGYNSCAKCRVSGGSQTSAATKKRKMDMAEAEAMRLHKYSHRSQTAAQRLGLEGTAPAAEPAAAPADPPAVPPAPVPIGRRTAPKVLRGACEGTPPTDGPGDELFRAMAVGNDSLLRRGWSRVKLTDESERTVSVVGLQAFVADKERGWWEAAGYQVQGGRYQVCVQIFPDTLVMPDTYRSPDVIPYWSHMHTYRIVLDNTRYIQIYTDTSRYCRYTQIVGRD